MEHWDYDTGRLEAACEGRFQDVYTAGRLERYLHRPQHAKPRRVGTLVRWASALSLVAWAVR